MTDSNNIAKGVGRPSYLGRTVPSLLYHATASYPNETAFGHHSSEGWSSYSNREFQRAAEETAQGLLACGLKPGDRVALYLDSDVYFCMVDMGCLMAGLVDVPIYLTNVPGTIEYVLEHADARALIVSDNVRLDELIPVLERCRSIQTVILANQETVDESLRIREDVQVHHLREIRSEGRGRIEKNPEVVRKASDRLDPSDLATIIYTSGTTGMPKGVMLTHENLSSNTLTSFSELTGIMPGGDARSEISLSFLPLTHVFARSHYLGVMAHGASIYFTTPDRLIEDLTDIRPTLVITVPRVLEKVYARILERTSSSGGIKGSIARWGLRKAQRADGRGTIAGGRIADRLVFQKWRDIFGGRLKALISGGAALSPEISNTFIRAGINVLQGYGLTETSPVISFNRPGANKPETVGRALPGVEIRIADDGEILTRGPHVMAGYFRDEEKTREVLDEEGWFYTGDIGAIDADGYLTITDRKKDLFKLSTGKYVIPQPVENRLALDPLIEQAVVIGAGHKFASALLFPSESALRGHFSKRSKKAKRSFAELVEDARVQALIQPLVDRANKGMPHWSTIKRFRLIPEVISVESGLLTPTLKIRRPQIRERFKDEIDALYADEHEMDLESSQTEN